MVFTLLLGAMCVLVMGSANVNTVLIGRTLAVEPDPLVVELVALDGHRMPLVKQERLDAIKMMVARNVDREVMAWRLCISLDALKRCAVRAGILLPSLTPTAHWSVDYMDKRLPIRKQIAKENAIRRGREYRERKRREASDNMA